MGFCLFNHVAVAARTRIEKHGLERVAIVDYDVHHGNGTQDAFYDDPRVLYVSTHEFPFYPGTGAAEEIGRAQGAATTSTSRCRMVPATTSIAARSRRSCCPRCAAIGRS